MKLNFFTVTTLYDVEAKISDYILGVITVVLMLRTSRRLR